MNKYIVWDRNPSVGMVKIIARFASQYQSYHGIPVLDQVRDGRRNVAHARFARQGGHDNIKASPVRKIKKDL